MRFAAIVHLGDTKEYEAGALPSRNALEIMGRFNDELIAAGVLLSGEGFHASAKGALVRFDVDGLPVVVGGPFEDTKNLIGGYWIWRVDSQEEAVAWAKRSPMDPGDSIELRQLFESADFDEEIAVAENARNERLKKLQGTAG